MSMGAAGLRGAMAVLCLAVSPVLAKSAMVLAETTTPVELPDTTPEPDRPRLAFGGSAAYHTFLNGGAPGMTLHMTRLGGAGRASLNAEVTAAPGRRFVAVDGGALIGPNFGAGKAFVKVGASWMFHPEHLGPGVVFGLGAILPVDGSWALRTEGTYRVYIADGGVPVAGLSVGLQKVRE